MFRLLKFSTIVITTLTFFFYLSTASHASPLAQAVQQQKIKAPDASFYLASGDKNFRSANFELARENYDHYLRLLPKNNASVTSRLAICDALTGGFDLAVKEFEQAAQLAGVSQTADLNRIDSCIVGQRYDEAMQRATDCCQHYPNAWKPFWRYGFISDKYCNYQEAVKAYSKSIELMPQTDTTNEAFEEISGLPTRKQLHSLRSQCYYRMQSYAACIKDCDIVIASAPAERQGYEARAEAKIQIHDFAGALADLEMAAKLHSNRPRTYKQRGLCELRLGRFNSAVASLTTAISLSKDYAEAFYFRSQALRKMGRNEESIRDEEEARRLGLHPSTAT